MHESSKLGYTSTSNGYKWAIMHKQKKSICGSLVIQVYIQVLMKTTFKQVIKSWSMKQNVNQYDHYVNTHVLELTYS